MRAIAIIPGTTTVHMIDVPEPTIVNDDEIKIKVLRVGICGTDREEVAGGRALAPTNQNELIIGHEMVGRVVAVGKKVTRVSPGDVTVLTVRRGCDTCVPCMMNRSDMCTTGNFSERGIWKQNGYETEFIVDKEQYAVKIPAALESIAVLTEPMSIVEKAIDEAVRIQSIRLPDAPSTPNWLFGRRCLVAGLGPVGLLGAMALRLRGAEVFGLDIVDENSSRPQWLKLIGGQYIDGRKIPTNHVDDTIGFMDVILEAAGIARLDFDLLDTLSTNGVYVLTGIPGGDRPIQVSGSAMMRTLVLKNQVMVGSVNASRDHFQMAVDDLARANEHWGTIVEKLITHRFPYPDFAKAFSEHTLDEIKSIIEWDAQ